MKYKKFIKGKNGYCIYCNMSMSDCCCGEESAHMLGYHYTSLSVPLPLKDFGEMPNYDNTKDGIIARLTESFRRSNENDRRKNNKIGVWRKGKTFFYKLSDLVDYHNNLENKDGQN